MSLETEKTMLKDVFGKYNLPRRNVMRQKKNFLKIHLVLNSNGVRLSVQVLQSNNCGFWN